MPFININKIFININKSFININKSFILARCIMQVYKNALFSVTEVELFLVKVCN